MSEPAKMPSKFHTSLNVSNIAASVNFYRLLLGVEPLKQKSDYAKFELDDPPLVLSLIPGRPNGGGALNHAGLRLPSCEDLVKVQHRLESAGIQTKREDGVECCYARQTKFWVTDPDRTLWELYVFHENTEERGEGDAPHDFAAQQGNTEAAPARNTWQHRIGETFPDVIPAADNFLHEIEFEGTANVSAALLKRAASEAFRALRPGGIIRIHGLSGDSSMCGPLPPLPGPAAAVKFVPSHEKVLSALRDPGFCNLTFERISEKAHFTVESVGLREFLITGTKPGHRTKTMQKSAVYLGPFHEVEDDFGNRFRRGQVTPLNMHDWQALKTAEKDNFVFLDATPKNQGCCGS